MLKIEITRWLRDSNKSASDKSGAVQTHVKVSAWSLSGRISVAFTR
jgi:hypothetical protein